MFLKNLAIDESMKLVVWKSIDDPLIIMMMMMLSVIFTRLYFDN